MIEWTQLLRDSLRTGAVAGAATTLAVAACGELEGGNAIAPLNATSHIIWGDEAATQDAVSWKYTATGVALNLAANTSWAALHELLLRRTTHKHSAVETLLGGAFISAVAYLTDYHVVPARLTPGFEKRLSNRSLFSVYTTLAMSLAVGSLWRPPAPF